MKFNYCCLALLMSVITGHAQTTITGTEWDNPLKTSVNRETAHTIAIPMASTPRWRRTT